jgi:hypothetical protein
MTHPSRSRRLVRPAPTLLALTSLALVASCSPGTPEDPLAGRVGDASESRVLPTAVRPLEPRGTGTLLPPFEADDVAHSAAGWALLDRGAGEVQLLDPLGAPTARFGRRGEGPGELARPMHIALGDDGSVGVLDASGRHLDVFPTPTGPARRLPLPAEDCPGSFGDALARSGDTWLVARRCFAGPRADLEVWRVPTTGSATRAVRRVLTSMNTDPYLVPLLIASEGAVYAGSNLEACLPSLDGSADRCLPRGPAVPIPDSTAQRLFGTLARRAAAVGIDLAIPTHYPGVVDVRPRAGDLAVRTVLANGRDAWAIAEGDTLRTLEPTNGARVEPGHRGWLLLRDDGAGLRIWVVRPGDQG